MDLTSSYNTIGIFLAIQLSAAIWWASHTNTLVEENHVAILKISDNSTDIAVIKNDIEAIKMMLDNNHESLNSVKESVSQLMYNYNYQDHKTRSGQGR